LDTDFGNTLYRNMANKPISMNSAGAFHFPDSVIRSVYRDLDSNQERLLKRVVVWEYDPIKNFPISAILDDILLKDKKVEGICYPVKINTEFLRASQREGSKGFVVRLQKRNAPELTVADRTIGFIFYKTGRSDNGEIKLICVGKNSLGEGKTLVKGIPIGKLLMELVEQKWAREAKRNVFDVKLEAVPQAVDFYRSIGYDGKRKKEGLTIMKKRLRKPGR
jgi:hypothetical protein